MKRIFDRREEIAVDCAPPEALKKIAGALEVQGWSIQRSDSQCVQAEHGSRFIFRMFGFFTKAGLRSIPARLEVRVSESESRVLAVRYYSNEGFHLAAHPVAGPVYRDHFQGTLGAIAESLKNN